MFFKSINSSFVLDNALIIVAAYIVYVSSYFDVYHFQSVQSGCMFFEDGCVLLLPVLSTTL
jgi:hypothetical protein